MIDLGPVDITELAKAIGTVEFGEPKAWNGQLTTANIGETHKFAEQGRVIADKLRLGKVRKHIASILVPGQGCEFHVDPLMDGTLGRVHIPITTNDEAWLCYEKSKHHLEVGRAYIVHIDLPHRVYNAGDTPRIHYMFDFEAY